MRTSPHILLSLVLTGGLFGQDPQNGGFEKIPFEEQETPPGMILVEGGVFDFHENGSLRKDSVASFYISSMEETNGQYLAYLAWMKKVYSRATYQKALPDTTVWLKENLTDSLKEYLVKNYLRGAAFRDYPVVGVSAEQVKKYAAWKSDRMNEMILIREGLLDFVEEVDSTDFFSTEAYLGGKWGRQLKQKLPSFDEQVPERDVRMEDGIFLPRTRMITANEWKVAAMAIGDRQYTYPKTPKEISKKKSDKQNHFGYLYLKETGIASNHALLVMKLANMGLRAVYRAPSNNYLLKGMYDNVNEWVQVDSGRYVAIGGSWKAPEPQYAWIYNENCPDCKAFYSSQHDFKSQNTEPDAVSAATGFRLAMDHIGSIDPRTKRRKAK